jgi:hypothetical protein
MNRPQRRDLKDQQVEYALEQLGFLGTSRHSTHAGTFICRMSRRPQCRGSAQEREPQAARDFRAGLFLPGKLSSDGAFSALPRRIVRSPLGVRLDPSRLGSFLMACGLMACEHPVRC